MRVTMAFLKYKGTVEEATDVLVIFKRDGLRELTHFMLMLVGSASSWHYFVGSLMIFFWYLQLILKEKILLQVSQYCCAQCLHLPQVARWRVHLESFPLSMIKILPSYLLALYLHLHRVSVKIVIYEKDGQERQTRLLGNLMTQQLFLISNLSHKLLLLLPTCFRHLSTFVYAHLVQLSAIFFYISFSAF